MPGCLFQKNMMHLTARSTRDAIEMQLRISGDSTVFEMLLAHAKRLAA